MKYEVYGTIEYNFRVVVDAETEQEAELEALGYAEDGRGLECPTGEMEVSNIKEMNLDKLMSNKGEE